MTNRIATVRFSDDDWMWQHTTKIDDVSPVSLSLKANLLGNNDGRFAIALAPYIAVPVDSSDDLSGFRVPFEIKLTESTRFNAMSGVDFYSRHTRYYGYSYTRYLESAQLRQTLGHNFDIYGQFFTYAKNRSADWIWYSGFGTAWRLTPNIEVQAGTDFGVTKGTDDYVVNSVIAVRF